MCDAFVFFHHYTVCIFNYNKQKQHFEKNYGPNQRASLVPIKSTVAREFRPLHTNICKKMRNIGNLVL